MATPSSGLIDSVPSSVHLPNAEARKVLPTPEWDRCHFYVTAKRRLCRQFPLDRSNTKDGPRYCGNHQHLSVASTLPEHDTENTSNVTQGSYKNNNKKRKRIACPVDGSHFIFEDQVAKHVKICPHQVRQDRQQEKEFYQHNVNLGGHGSLPPGSITLEEPESRESSKWPHKLAIRILEVHHQLFGTDPIRTSTCEAKDSKVNQQHLGVEVHDAIDVKRLSQSDILEAVPLLDCHREEIEDLNKSVNRYRIKSGGPQHLAQQASFIGHLRRILVELSGRPQEVQLTSQDCLALESTATPSRFGRATDATIILEMGAGRGMLGLMVAGVFAAQGEPTHLIMIERSGTRGKADKVLRAAVADGTSTTTSDKSQSPNDYMDLARIQSWRRVRCDLAHIHLPALLQSSAQLPIADSPQNMHSGGSLAFQNTTTFTRLVVIAKHLCGAGTDLALKSLVPVRDKVDVCLMATCCHGVCSWEHYVGRDYLLKVLQVNGFGQKEFDLLRRWAANASHGPESFDEDTTLANDSIGNVPEQDIDPFVCRPCQRYTQIKISSPIQHGNDDEVGGGILNVVDPSGIDQNRDADEISKDPNLSIHSIVKTLDLACGVSGFGKACQRLIDYGRQEFLRQVIFQDDDSEQGQLVNLCSFVPFSVTPQNTLLLAYRKH